MIDLSEVSGLPIKFDDETGKFVLSDELYCESECQVRLSEIIPVLLNKYLKYPEVVYSQHKNIFYRGIDEPPKTSYDLFYVPYGLLGIEYIKTHVYFSELIEGKYACIVEVLSGELTVILQKNLDRENDYQYDTYVEDLSILILKKSHKLVIPTGYFYTFINTGSHPLVFSKVSATAAKTIDYEILKTEKGLACYVISTNAKIETVANPKYKVPHKLKPASMSSYVDKKVEDGFIRDMFKNKKPLFAYINKLDRNFIA